MGLRNHLRQIFSFAGRSLSPQRPKKKPGHSKPAIETLEDRLALSVASSVSAIGGIKDFYIDRGAAYLHDSQQTKFLIQNAQSISAVQDPSGYARAAILLQNGELFDYFDEPAQIGPHGLKYELSNVTQACAGYAFDAVLGGGKSSGVVMDLNPYSGTWKAFVTSTAVWISAGEDRDFLPMIAYVDKTNHAYEWRLGTTNGSGYTESLGGGVYQVSAGQNGVVALLTFGLGPVGQLSGGWAYNHYDDAYVSYGGAFTTPGTWKFLAADAVAVSAGTDVVGKAMTEVLFSGTGQVKEYSDACGVRDLGTGWREVDAGLGGISNLVRQAIGGAAIGTDDIWRHQDGFLFHPDSWVSLVNNDLY